MSARDTVVASKEVPAPPRQPRFSLRAPRDPGFAALRRAARAAIVIPLAFALGTFVLHLGQNVIFIVFGCFALLVITDFGGLRPARARAYLTATAVGAGLVALGSFVSLTIAAAAAVTFMVALVISFARVFGGYFVAGQTGMLLAYIVATAVPAPSSSIPTRVGAFALAGVISTLAGVFMWPRFERVTLCKQAAKACLRMADLVEALNAGGDATELQRWIDAARAAEQAARREYVATAKRPAGPARRDRALAQLLIELQRIVDIVEHPFYQYRASVVPRIAERDRLAASTVAALRASADVLTSGTPPDLRAVEDDRLAHRAALDRWAGEELKAGRPADQGLDGLDGDHTLRVIAYLTIALGSNAIITAGGRPEVNVGRSVSASGGLGGVMPSRSRDDPHAPRPLFHGGPIESARGYRPGHCRGAGESPGTTARILGRPGNAPGAAIERAGHRTHDGAGDRRQPAGRRPWWALRPRRGHQQRALVVGPPIRHLPRRLCVNRHRLRGRSGSVQPAAHHHVHPHRSDRVADWGRSHRGPPGRCRDQRRGRRAPVAARRATRAGARHRSLLPRDLRLPRPVLRSHPRSYAARRRRSASPGRAPGR